MISNIDNSNSYFSWGGVIEICSQGIGRLAVPIFFFISGYLFFYKIACLDMKTYQHKLTRRIKSLLIPYFIWNLIILVIYILLFQCYGIELKKFVEHLDLNTIIKAFVGFKQATGAFPIVYQMWFIRDLISVIIISPIIFFLIKRLKILYIGFVGILWILGLEIPLICDYCLSMSSIFYFSFGAYFSIFGYQVMRNIYRLKFIGYSYPILLFLDLSTKSIVIHNIAILCGMILVFLIGGYLLESGKIRPNPFLSSSSFFVFAIHDPLLLSGIRKIIVMVLPNYSFLIVVGYFVTIALTVVISLCIYYIMKKHMPKTMALLTGGR